MANASIVFDLIGRDRASADFDRVGRAAERSSRSMRLLASAGKVAAGGALLGAGALLKMAKGAAEDQAAQVRLATALRNSAGATRSQVAGVEDWITAQGKAFGVADDDLRPALIKLVGATKDVGQAQQLASLAMNVSAGQGKSLETVATALAKAQNGQVTALGKLGVKVKESTQDTVAFQKATVGADKARGKYNETVAKYGAASEQAKIAAKEMAIAEAKVAEARSKTKKTTVDFLEAQKRLAAQNKGQAAAAANTLAGRFERVKLMLSETGESIGASVLPPLTDLAEDLMPKAVKAGQRFGDWLEDNQGQIRATAGELKDNLTPVIKGAVDVFQTAAGVIKGLPEPLRSIAIQGGLAALVFPRIAGAAAAASGGLSTFVGGIRNAETRTAALGGALRNVSGIGGMLLLAQGAQQADRSLGILSSAAGGALLGFSLGGPWGAAIGAGAGALVGLATNTRKAGDAAYRSRTTWQNYADTLNNVTGATTAATRQMIVQDLQQSGLLKTASKLGISATTMVNGVLGQAKARNSLTLALQGEEGKVRELAAAYKEKYDSAAARSANPAEAKAMRDEIVRRREAIDALRAEIGEVEKSTAKRAEQIAVLKNIPTAVVTRIQTPGAVKTAADIAALSRLYKLTPQQVRTAIKLSGVKTSVDEVRKVGREIRVTGDARTSQNWLKTLGSSLVAGRTNAKTGAAGINALLGATGNTKPKVTNGPFGAAFRAQIQTMTQQARGGGTGIGNQMGAGFAAGLGAWLGPIKAQARSTVNAAVAEARAAAQVRSPSRKTTYIGRMMGEGLAVGIGGTSAKVRAAAGGVTTGAADVAAKVASKANKAAEAAAKKARERIKQSIEAAQRALEKYRDRLKGFLDFRNSIRDSVMGSLFGDQGTEGQLNAGGLLAAAQDRVAKMKAFLANITKLREGKLDRTLLQQLISRGVDQAGGDAAALVAGGASAIRGLNDQQAALSRYANAIADQASLSQNGMTAAQIRAGMRAADARYAGNRTTYNVYVKTLPGGERAAALEFEKIIIRAERALGRPIKIGGR